MKFWVIAGGLFGNTNGDGYFFGNALLRRCVHSLFVYNAYNLGCGVWVFFKIFAFKWGFILLCMCVYAHREGDLLWELREKNGMECGGGDIYTNDGNGVYGVCVTLGANVVLGGDGDN